MMPTEGGATPPLQQGMVCVRAVGDGLRAVPYTQQGNGLWVVPSLLHGKRDGVGRPVGVIW